MIFSESNKKRATAKDIARMVRESEKRAMSIQGVVNFCTTHGIEKDNEKKYNIEEFFEIRKQRKEEKLEKAGGSNARERKLNKEIELLELRIQKTKENLYTKEEVTKASTQLVADFRSSLKSWLDHTSAKYPEHAAQWHEAHDLAIKAVADGLSI